MSSKVRVFEVGPRDGLQNEPTMLPLRDKVRFVEGLASAGLRDLELGAFVRPDRVPQMADTDRLYEKLRRLLSKKGAPRAWTLVPNERGMERAIAAKVQNIAVFTAATESFAKRNIGMSIRESLKVFERVIRQARAHKMGVRGYVSVALGCPFEGAVSAKRALHVIEALAGLGVDQISIGDTIGVATPKEVRALVAPAIRMLGGKKTAMHLHDTRGTALANALQALELGVQTLDSSAGGLGGCPFAPGATGNLATEDLVYMLNGMGVRTGVNLDRLCRVSLDLSRRMKRPIASRYLQAWVGSCK